jgi:predicted  nucleic acid-binding Zn-ribbon protein
MDAIDGLAALEQVVETIGEQLDDLYQRRDIPQAERVTLRSLEWTLAKLADDLHTMGNEIKDLRLAEAAARRELADMQQRVVTSLDAPTAAETVRRIIEVEREIQVANKSGGWEGQS